VSVAASHSEYQIYLINIAPIYDKKQPKTWKVSNFYRRLITTMMLLPTIVYYNKKRTLPRMLKYFQVIKISKKVRLSGPIYEKIKKTTNRYYVHVWKSEG